MQVVVALKDVDQAKSRLGGVLDPGTRRDLVTAMATDLVDLVGSIPCFTRLTVVAGAGWRETMFRAPKLTLVRERDLGVRGLNLALEAVIRTMGPTPGVVLHGDLPYLGADDLVELHSHAAKKAIVLCPDEAGTGTNAIAARDLSGLRFAFGPDSFGDHLKMAMTSGSSWHILRRPGVSRDLDTPADLQALLGHNGRALRRGTRIRAWARDHRKKAENTTFAGSSPMLPTAAQGAASS